MGTIINTKAYIKPLVVLDLYDLQPDGTILTLEYSLIPDTLYRIKYYDIRENTIMTINGKYVSFINDPCCCCEKIIGLLIDVSKETKSDIRTVYVKDIKSIETIETL